MLWVASASLQTNKLNIYSTVCVEFVALTNEVYTLWLSPDLTDWNPHPVYNNYTPNETERIAFWDAEGAMKGFFYLQTGTNPPSFAKPSERASETSTNAPVMMPPMP